jgi:hypothetical protein
MASPPVAARAEDVGVEALLPVAVQRVERGHRVARGEDAGEEEGGVEALHVEPRDEEREPLQRDGHDADLEERAEGAEDADRGAVRAVGAPALVVPPAPRIVAPRGEVRGLWVGCGT